MHVRFSVDCIPKGKARPRVTVRGNYAHAYTPKSTAEYEETIRRAYISTTDYKYPEDAYLSLQVTIKMPILKSFSKKQKQQALSGELLPAKKPDVDNIVKAICDSLNNVAYHDDAQIVSITATKIYAEQPGLDIELNYYKGEINNEKNNNII